MTSEKASQDPAVDLMLEQAVRDIGIPPRPIVLERINAQAKPEVSRSDDLARKRATRRSEATGS